MTKHLLLTVLAAGLLAGSGCCWRRCATTTSNLPPCPSPCIQVPPLPANGTPPPAPVAPSQSFRFGLPRAGCCN